MIKYVRKIRPLLLQDGKLNKYLLYAVGEIFLVVIGILIAMLLIGAPAVTKGMWKRNIY